MYFIPMTHEREDAFYAQNCIKFISVLLTDDVYMKKKEIFCFIDHTILKYCQFYVKLVLLKKEIIDV